MGYFDGKMPMPQFSTLEPQTACRQCNKLMFLRNTTHLCVQCEAEQVVDRMVDEILAKNAARSKSNQENSMTRNIHTNIDDGVSDESRIRVRLEHTWPSNGSFYLNLNDFGACQGHYSLRWPDTKLDYSMDQYGLAFGSVVEMEFDKEELISFVESALYDPAWVACADEGWLKENPPELRRENAIFEITSSGYYRLWK